MAWGMRIIQLFHHITVEIELVSTDLKNNWSVFEALLDDDTPMKDVAAAAELIQLLPKYPKQRYDIRLVAKPCEDEFGTKLRGSAKSLGENTTLGTILESDCWMNFRLRAVPCKN